MFLYYRGPVVRTMSTDRITSPEHLANGHRYHVWYAIPSPKASSGVACGVFTDVFRELTGGKDGLFLEFHEQPRINWLHVTCITNA